MLTWSASSKHILASSTRTEFVHPSALNRQRATVSTWTLRGAKQTGKESNSSATASCLRQPHWRDGGVGRKKNRNSPKFILIHLHCKKYFLICLYLTGLVILVFKSSLFLKEANICISRETNFWWSLAAVRVRQWWTVLTAKNRSVLGEKNERKSKQKSKMLMYND